MRSVIETLIREGTLLCLFFLPKERRIAIERRIRGRFEWQKLQGCDVVIVSFGKSGRTWLRVMMSRLYQRRYGLPERMLLQYDNMHRRRNEVPKVHYSHDNYLKDYTGNQDNKSDYRATPVVLLARHPARRNGAIDGPAHDGVDIGIGERELEARHLFEELLALRRHHAVDLALLDQPFGGTAAAGRDHQPFIAEPVVGEGHAVAFFADTVLDRYPGILEPIDRMMRRIVVRIGRRPHQPHAGRPQPIQLGVHVTGGQTLLGHRQNPVPAARREHR